MATIDIPLRSHLYKYVQRHPFLKGADQTVTTTDCVGMVLLMLLEPPPRIQMRSDVRKTLNRFPLYRENNWKIMKVSLGSNKSNTYKCHLSPASIWSFNQYIEQLFNHAFISFVRQAESSGRLKIKQAIDEFLSIYDLEEEEIAFDTLKKRYQRHRNLLESLVAVS